MSKLIKVSIAQTNSQDKRSSVVYLNPDFISSISTMESGGMVSNKVAIKMSNGSDFVVEKADLGTLLT